MDAMQAQGASEAAAKAEQAAKAAEAARAAALAAQTAEAAQVARQAQGDARTSAAEMYQAARAMRRELVQQRDRVQAQRDDLARELIRQETQGSPVDKAGIEARLRDLDARLLDLDKQVAAADQQVAQAAAIPGAAVEPPPPPRAGPPEEVFIIPIVGIIFIGFPIAVAYARRIWKRGATVVAPVPREVQARIEQVAQSVEAMAVEVVRIGEGQRFLTRLLSEAPARLPLELERPVDRQRRVE